MPVVRKFGFGRITSVTKADGTPYDKSEFRTAYVDVPLNLTLKELILESLILILIHQPYICFLPWRDIINAVFFIPSPVTDSVDPVFWY
jgi:hypothetical protein